MRLTNRASRRALGAVLALALAAPTANAETQTVAVGASHKMRAILITPDAPGPRPAILVLHTSGGLQTADTQFAEALAREGYVALVPAFMEAYGIVGRTRRETFTGDAQPIYDDLVAALAEIAEAAHAPYELKLYPGVDHRFERMPEMPAAREAAADAWQRSLAFLAANLRPR
jgi:dienelactone hydrolase